MVIIGIDPGLKGGIALRHGAGIPKVAAMPMLNQKTIDWRKIDATVREEEVEMVFIEDIFALPKCGIRVALTIGRNYAFPVLCQVLEIPYEIVRAKAWQKVMLAGLPTFTKPERKHSSIVAAQRLFPSLIDDIGKHDGKAEALLIMEYGRRLVGAK